MSLCLFCEPLNCILKIEMIVIETTHTSHLKYCFRHVTPVFHSNGHRHPFVRDRLQFPNSIQANLLHIVNRGLVDVLDTTASGNTWRSLDE